MIRAAATCGPIVLLEWTARVLGAADLELAHDVAQIVAVVTFPVLLLFLLYAAIRTPGKRTVWDRLSNTMVRYRTRRVSNPV
jgi:hypothetical protein